MLSVLLCKFRVRKDSVKRALRGETHRFLTPLSANPAFGPTEHDGGAPHEGLHGVGSVLRGFGDLLRILQKMLQTVESFGTGSWVFGFEILVFGTKFWLFGTLCWVFGTTCWVFGTTYWVITCWVFGRQCWVFGTGSWVFGSALGESSTWRTPPHSSPPGRGVSMPSIIEKQRESRRSDAQTLERIKSIDLITRGTWI